MNACRLALTIFCAALLLGATPRAVAQGESGGSVQHLAGAIRHETVSRQDPATIDRDAFSAFLRFLARTYTRTFSQLDVEILAQYSVLLRWSGDDADVAPVLFDAHYDVVPVEDGTVADWTYPPFGGVVADGYLWGRGAQDNKIAVIATLEAIEALLADGFRPQRTLYFSFGHDEEVGGNEGAAAIAARLASTGVELAWMVGEGGVIVDDYPLLPGRALAMIGLAEKSYLTVTLTAAGEGGHSSFPPRDNAVIRLGRALDRLHDRPFDAKLVPPVSNLLETLAPHVGGLRGFLFANQWIAEPLIVAKMDGLRSASAMIRTTTAVTMFRAGVKENVVPQVAEATVNFRLLPGDTPDGVIDHVTRAIDDSRIAIAIDAAYQTPPVADPDGPGYAAIRTAIESVLPGAVVAPGLVIATTDTRHYAALTRNIYRFHPMRFHVDDVESIHGTNERIAVDAVAQAVAITIELIRQSANPGPANAPVR